ncbi:MAG: type 4a pilus biogenesis protein PilO [Candidatus Omnitrophota bacterium]
MKNAFDQLWPRAKPFLSGISRDRKILGGVIISLVGFLLYESLLSSQLVRLKADSLQLRSERKLLASHYVLAENLDEVTRDVRTEEQSLRRFKDQFVRENELSDYFTSLRNIIKSHNTEVVSLDVKPQENVGPGEGQWFVFFLKQPFDISLKGDYANIMDLFHRLEFGKPHVTIESFHIRPESAGSYDVVMDLRVAVYLSIDRTQYATL